MNDKFRNFHIIRSRAVPQKNIKDLQSKIIAELINVVIPTTSIALALLIIPATSYVGMYLVATMLSEHPPLVKKVNLSKCRKRSNVSFTMQRFLPDGCCI